MFACSGTFGCHSKGKEVPREVIKVLYRLMEQYAERKEYQDEHSVIGMARLHSRCCGLEKDETETRIEVRPLRDPASHDKPEKKDDIS